MILLINCPISSEEFFDHIWEDHADPFTKVIRVHVYSLRKKLTEATGYDQWIETIKGSGYCLRGNDHEEI